ncbi:MAG: ethanolamine utilization acetate kinase EutQ [Propionivibrio sp.]
MKILISAETVRQAKASGQTSLPAGNNVLITPEARGLADQLGITLDASNDSMTLAPATAPANNPQLDALRAEVVSRLPAYVASKPELVEQIVSKVCQAQKNAPAATCPVNTTPGGIKLVKGSDVHLGVFPGAGADKQVGIADVITSADGAPIAAGFMAWSQCFFPWTLDYDEIDLVLEGELHIRCNGQTYVGKAGDVFYIPKGSAIEFGTTTAVRFFYVTYPANWQG